jgi:hypothetical protein
MKLNLSKSEWILFIAFGVIILIAPVIITQKLNLISFTDTGEIGDTIGGITAPILGFFGSILVYLALKAQIEANEQVRLQFLKLENEQLSESRKEYFRSKSNLILNEINSFYYSFKDSENLGISQKLNYEGSQAILKLLENSKNTYFGKTGIKSPDLIEPKLKELESLLVFFELTIIELRNDSLLVNNEKDEMVQFLKYIFESKLRNNFKRVEKFKSVHNGSCPENCGNFHGIPAYLFELADNIILKIDAT